MRSHRTDLVSFAFGLLFVALAAWWLLAQVLGLVLPPVGWFLAGGLILVGGLGLIGALRSSRYNSRPTPADPRADTGQDDPARDTGDDAADPLPDRADVDTSTGESTPVSSARTAEPEPLEDRTLDLFGAAEETPPSGRQGRDA